MGSNRNRRGLWETGASHGRRVASTWFLPCGMLLRSLLSLSVLFYFVLLVVHVFLCSFYFLFRSYKPRSISQLWLSEQNTVNLEASYKLIFSWFWRLELQSQGASLVQMRWGLFSWLVDGRLLCPHMMEIGGEISGDSSRRPLILSWGAPFSTSSKPNCLPKAPSLSIITLALRLQHTNLGEGETHLVHNTVFEYF